MTHIPKAGENPAAPRLQECQCKIHLDMHCPEWDDAILSRFDAEEIAREVSRTGANALYFFAKDHYGNAYYPTRIGHTSSVIGNRDLLAEMLEACRKHRIRLVAYYSVVWDVHIGKAHPEWLQRDARGSSFPEYPHPQKLTRWLTLCHNSGYMDYARDMVREIARTYEVDGFHLDMFHLEFGKTACCCETCRRMFRERYRADIPQQPTWDTTWRRFLEFRYDSVERAMRLLVDAAREARPGIFVTTNYHGSPGFDWRPGQLPVRHAMMGSMATGETYTPALGDLYPGMEGRYLRNLIPGAPFELVCWRMNRITDFTNKPLHQFRWEALTSAALGASVMVIDQPYYDGTLDPIAYDRMEVVFKELNNKKEYFGGEYLRHAAIYYSAKTRDWYGRDKPGKYQLPVMGMYKALVESHYPVDFLFDESVTPERLATFPVICLPNIAILSEKECAFFRDYVNNGGALLATEETSLYDEDGNALTDYRLAGLFGVRLDHVPETQWYFWRGLPDALGEDIDPRYYVLGTGPFQAVRTITADAYGDLHEAFHKRTPPDTYFSHSVHPPSQRVGSAVFINRVGNGMAIFAPFGLAHSYADRHELPEHRLLLRNLLRWAGPKPLAEVVSAPLNMEVITSTKGGKLYIHLLMFNATRQSTALDGWDNPMRPSLRMDEPVMAKVVIDVNTPFRNAAVCGKDSILKIEGKRIDVVMNDVHDVICLDIDL